MLATVSYITPEIADQLPGYLSPSMDQKFADVPNGLTAISKVGLGTDLRLWCLLRALWCPHAHGEHLRLLTSLRAATTSRCSLLMPAELTDKSDVL